MYLLIEKSAGKEKTNYKNCKDRMEYLGSDNPSCLGRFLQVNATNKQAVHASDNFLWSMKHINELA